MSFPRHPLNPRFRKVVPLFGDDRSRNATAESNNPIYFATIDALGDPHIWPVDWAGIALQAWKRKRNR